MTGVWPGLRNCMHFCTSSITCLTKGGSVDLSEKMGNMPISAGGLMVLASSRLELNTDHVTISPFCSSSFDINPENVVYPCFVSTLRTWNPVMSGPDCPSIHIPWDQELNSSGIHGRNYYMIVWELWHGRICGVDSDWFTSYPHVLLWEVIDKRDCHTLEFIIGWVLVFLWSRLSKSPVVNTPECILVDKTTPSSSIRLHTLQATAILTSRTHS